MDHLLCSILEKNIFYDKRGRLSFSILVVFITGSFHYPIKRTTKSVKHIVRYMPYFIIQTKLIINVKTEMPVILITLG